MSNQQVLLLIAAFLTLTIGSFVYYIATWDAQKEQPVSMRAPSTAQLAFISPKQLPPEAPASQRRAIT